MHKIIFGILVLAMLSVTGCARLDPRLKQNLQNQNGQIEDLRNNQNGVMTEIGKLRQQAEIQNSELDEVQAGVVNLNNALSRNQNSGIQILQGDGALIVVFGLGVVGMLLWYRSRAVKNEKAVEILSHEIARFNDPVLNDNILKAALNSNTERHIYHLLTKHQQNLAASYKS